MVERPRMRECEREKRGRGRATREVPREELRADRDYGRRNGKEIRDKETDTDNEKTSAAKKKVGDRGPEGRRKKGTGVKKWRKERERRQTNNGYREGKKVAEGFVSFPKR